MNTKFIFAILIIVCVANSVFGQHSNSVSIIDFVKVKNGKQKEAIFYYENNWKVYRDIALKKGFIKSYKMMSTQADSIADFDIILVTEYADSLQYTQAEERFQVIIKEVSPNGSKLLNELKPSDFRINLFFREAKTLLESTNKKGISKNKY